MHNSKINCLSDSVRFSYHPISTAEIVVQSFDLGRPRGLYTLLLKYYRTRSSWKYFPISPQKLLQHTTRPAVRNRLCVSRYSHLSKSVFLAPHYKKTPLLKVRRVKKWGSCGKNVLFLPRPKLMNHHSGKNMTTAEIVHLACRLNYVQMACLIHNVAFFKNTPAKR
jgi:hypothetical protein